MSVRLKKCRQRLVRLDHRLHQLQADFTICGVRSEAGDGLPRAIMCVQRAKEAWGEQITDDITAALERRRRRTK